MGLIDQLAEAHIQKAMENGEFNDLAGEGQPLQLDDDSLVPAELRAGYRLLKNSGHLPAELQLHSEIKNVEALIQVAESSDEQQQHQKRLNYLRTQLSMMNGSGHRVWSEEYYRQRLQNKFTEPE